MKSFKFFNKPKFKAKIFTMSIATNIFGRIPTSDLVFVPFDGAAGTFDVAVTIKEFSDGNFYSPWVISSLTVIREPGDSLTITYDNVDEMNRGNYIFNNNEKVMVRFQTPE
jgi:hypothetical protein